MLSSEGRPVGTILVAIPVLIALTGVLLRCLPHDCAAILTLWTCLSLPLGVGIGHCILNED
ncbi:MAG TPA: hypothetical protein VIG49_15785 [Acetobacteraceae bacterium]